MFYNQDSDLDINENRFCVSSIVLGDFEGGFPDDDVIQQNDSGEIKAGWFGNHLVC